MSCDREVQDSLRLLNATPAGRQAQAMTAADSTVHDPAVREWFATHGLPIDASGSLEM